MEQPVHDLRPFQATQIQTAPRRAVAIAAVAAIHIIAIIGLATGLAQNLIRKQVEEFKAEVIPPKQEQVKPPPPPPPELQKPPPPFVPPPDINIQAETPTTTITTQSKISTPPPPKPVAPPGISAPVSFAQGHNCMERFYPPIAVRLNQEGNVLVRIGVAVDGSVTNAEVVRSSGHDSLDQATIRCIMAGWHYKPAMQNGQPVAAQTEANVQWKLQ